VKTITETNTQTRGTPPYFNHQSAQVFTTKTSKETAYFMFGAVLVYCLGVLKSTLGASRAATEAAK
jgi:hypothetical protein